MDKIDYKLISLLQEDARMPLKQLAERVFLSSPATAARLERLEKSGIISGYSVNDARVFGFVSERLLDVWVETRGLDYTEMPVVFTEHQNWLKKGGAFLKRKFAGGRQKEPDSRKVITK